MMASLVADYGESSQESSEDSENDSHFDKSESVINERLPPPAFTNKIKNSVFVNPYLEAENAKFAVLEKHVKMVPQNNNATGSKKVCWMFKKGKCRFGKKCKFSHHMEDACLQANSLNQQDAVTKELDSNSIVSDQTKIVVDNENLINNLQENLSDEDNNSMKKRKKHLGLTQGLIPSKKVIKMYKKQKAEENK
uniref:C3H1-type domain-containing protein n=1 Tax=Triatoma dimidiata TaxID=72491 RepID=A0A0V0GA26_TRIDM